MADQEIFRLDLDTDDFIEAIKSSADALDKLGKKSESLDAIVTSIGTATKLLGAMTIAFVAAKTALDWTEEAESIRQLGAEFESLTEQFGLSASALEQGLQKASAGTISETELLKLANKAIIELGDNAKDLPAVMELARKAAAAFGGTAASNFEAINQAIASGNTRMLKHIGIKIDAQKVEIDYAKSIGTTVDALSQSGKQAAIMAAVLKQGSEQFKNVNADALQTQTSLQVIKSSLSDVGEAFVLAFEKLAGPAVKYFVTQLKYGAQWMKKAFSPDTIDDFNNKLNSQLDQTQQKLMDLYQRMDTLNRGGSILDRLTTSSTIDEKKQTIQVQIDQAKKAIEQINAEKMKLMEQNTPAGGESPETKQSKVDLDKQLAQQTAFNKDVQKLRDETLKAAIAGEKSLADVERNYTQQREQVEEDYQQKISELKAKATMGKISPAQMAQAEILLEQLKNQQIINLDKDLTDRKVAALERFSETSQSAQATFIAGWDAAALKATKEMQNFSSIGGAAFSTINSRASEAFKSIGNGSKTAGQAMQAFFVGAIADMATKQGELFLMQGIGRLAQSYGADPTGYTLIAEGGGLIALGALLGSAGSSSTSSSGGSAGVSTSTPTDAGGGNGGVAAPDASNVTPGKNVTVQIMGHLFETDETKQRLMEMIRQESDATSFNYNQIGV